MPFDGIALFYLWIMANCRITNLKPPCGYNAEGITAILLLDAEDFTDFLFDDNGTYGTALVSGILRSGDFIEVDAPQLVARYTSTGLYVHTLETFILELSAPMLAQLHLATKRRYIVVFRTTEGRYFSFGYGTGATVRYAAQTADNVGAAVTITASNAYPLFEVNPDAVTDGPPAQRFRWVPMFDIGATCAIDGETDLYTGMLNAGYAVKVSAVTGLPLGADNQPVTEDNPQAILVIAGGTNPDPLTYIQVGTFAAGAVLSGDPTFRYDPETCPPETSAGWILETGFWEMDKFWLDDGIWNY